MLLTMPRPVAVVTQVGEPSIQADWGVSRVSASEKVLEVSSVIIESVMPVLELPGALPDVWGVITPRARSACR